jgi:hypothetical protein
MNHLQKSRVTVDFFAHERDVLQSLCEQDVRPPQDQLRWLVLNEAKRRGLQSPENSKIASVKVATTTTGDFAGINP